MTRRVGGRGGEARPGGTGSMSLTSISVHVRMLDQIIDERTQNSVFWVYVKTISMFSENLSVTHGECQGFWLFFQRNLSGQTVGKTSGVLPCTAART